MRWLLAIREDDWGTVVEIGRALARVDGVEARWLPRSSGRRAGLVARATSKLGVPVLPAGRNVDLVRVARRFGPDAVFVPKGVEILPATLVVLKRLGAKLVSWSQDDMFARHNRTLLYTRGLRLYDLVVTQKSYNCDPGELPALGARRVLFQNKAYSRDAHRPCDDCARSAFAHDVVFVGSAEEARANSLLALARADVAVDVYGAYEGSHGWRRWEGAHPLLRVHDKPVFGKDFSCALGCSKIALNFLRKANRDLQTSRSVEIPACGGFMLAERTDEHRALFEEGKEAEYFATDEELVAKARRYLADDAARRAVALAGRRRCETSDYSYDARAREIVEAVRRL